MNIAEQISKMDVKSEEFFELYKLVDEKYWTIENPDQDQMSRSTLRTVINNGEAWLCEMLVNLTSQLLRVAKEGGETAGSFGIDKKEIWFTFSDKPGPLGKLQTALRNTVIVKAREQSESNQAEGDKGE